MSAKSAGFEKQIKEGGYTLIELMVTVSIFIIIGTQIMASHPRLTRGLNLSRTSEEIALGFRETQAKAMGVEAFRNPQSGAFVYPPFGINFDKNKPQEFAIFADTNQNGSYDSANQEEVKKFLIRGASIADICVSSGEEPPADCNRQKIDVVYTRPEPVVTIKTTGGGQNIPAASVVVSSPDGKQNRIVVWITGQIYVESVQ